MRRVGLAGAAVEVPLADDLGRQAQARARSRSMISSMTSMPCGPPKPRNAVCETTLVFATRPEKSHVRHVVRVVEMEERAVADRTRRDRATSRRRRRADAAAPGSGPRRRSRTRSRAWNGCRLPGERHVEVAVEHARAPGRPVRHAASATSAAQCCPASPSRRSRRPCAATARRPCCAAGAARATTMAWISEGCWVDEADEDVAVVAAAPPTPPASPGRNAPARRSRIRRSADAAPRAAPPSAVSRGRMTCGSRVVAARADRRRRAPRIAGSGSYVDLDLRRRGAARLDDSPTTTRDHVPVK